MSEKDPFGLFSSDFDAFDEEPKKNSSNDDVDTAALLREADILASKTQKKNLFSGSGSKRGGIFDDDDDIDIDSEIKADLALAKLQAENEKRAQNIEKAQTSAKISLFDENEDLSTLLASERARMAENKVKSEKDTKTSESAKWDDMWKSLDTSPVPPTSSNNLTDDVDSSQNEDKLNNKPDAFTGDSDFDSEDNDDDLDVIVKGVKSLDTKAPLNVETPVEAPVKKTSLLDNLMDFEVDMEIGDDFDFNAYISGTNDSTGGSLFD